jgi:hypothetical protein
MTREVICPGCGDRRTLSIRHARRNAGSYGRPSLCKLCRTPRPKPPTDSDRRYWLERFSDEDIVLLAWAFWKEERDDGLEYCHEFRLTLLGKDALVAA